MKILIVPLSLVVGFILARNLFWFALGLVLWVLEKIDGDVQQSEHDGVPEVQAGGVRVGLSRSRGQGMQEPNVLPSRP